MGVALSQIWGKALPDTKVTVQSTKASAENLNLLQAGRGEMALVLGDALFRSQIMATIESVEGVSNCSLVISPLLVDGDGNAATAARTVRAADDSIRRISARPEQLLYLDKALSQITVSSHEWSL
jgi:hypothetical protein